MEVGRDLVGRDDGDVVGQLRVQRACGPRGRRPTVDRDRGDLATRVHAGVGPPGDRELAPAREHRLERRPHVALDRPQPRLSGPAVEIEPVVLERQLELPVGHQLDHDDGMATTQKYDLYSEDFRARRFDVYAQMRERDPVLLQPGIDGETPIWFLTRYDDVVAMLLDDQRFVRDPALFLAHDPADWLAVCPHDARPLPGCLARVVAEADAQARAGLASADVGDSLTPVVDRYFGAIPAPATVARGWEPAGYPHGTLMLASRRCLEDIGLFDERYFAYCEEAELAIRAKAAGWQVGVVRGAEVRNMHVGSRAAVVDYLQLRNTLLMVREHSGLYHATIRLLIALWQLASGAVVPSRRGPYWAPRARVLAIADHLRGRYGPPPAELFGPASEPGSRHSRPVSASASSGRTRTR